MRIATISRQVHALLGLLPALRNPRADIVSCDVSPRFKLHLQNARAVGIVFLFCLLIGCSTTLNAQASCNFAAGVYNPCNYDTANIVQEMIHPHSNLVMLCTRQSNHTFF